MTYIEDKDLDDPEAEPVPMEFSQANAAKLFSTRSWLLVGIDDFLGDKSNFLREIVGS